MSSIEVEIPARHVKAFVMSNSFPVVVTVDPDGDKMSISGERHYTTYKAPDHGLHIKRVGGTVLGTITARGVYGAITEDAARDLKALRAAYYNTDFEIVIAYTFKRPTIKREYVHPHCRAICAAKLPNVELKPQLYLKGTPDCAVCGRHIE